MDKYRIVMEFDIIANSPKDARKKVQIFNKTGGWLLQCSILKLSVHVTQRGLFLCYKEIK